MKDQAKTKKHLIEELEALRKQAEEALQDSEKRFKTLFKKSAEAQLLLNHEGKVVDCNDAFLDLFALQDKTEVIGHTPEDFAPEFQPNGALSREKGDEILKTVLERGSARYEWAHFKHDASRTPVLTELICTLISIAGRPMLHAAIRDITERKKAEEALQESKDLLRNTIEATADGILVVNKKGEVTHSNKRFAEMWRIPSDLIVQKDDAKLLSYVLDQLEDSNTFLSKVKKLYKSTGEDVDKLFFKDKRVFERFSAPLLRDGEIEGRVWSFRDITKRMKAEGALRDSEKLFRTLVESTPTGIWQDDTDHRTVYINSAMCHMLEVENANEIFGQEWQSFFTTESLKKVAHEHRKRLEGIASSYELEMVGKRGGKRIVLVYGAPLLSDDGRLQGTIATFLDVTDRKRAEEALMASEEKYRLVVENANDAIFIVQDEIIKFRNRQSIAILGYTKKELTGVHFSHFLHADDKDMVMDRLQRRLRGEDVPSVYSFRIINKAGETLWVEISTELSTWEGRPATLNFLRDITVQKKLEEQLLQAQKMEAIGQLAGGVAHDFNNLLTAIIGYGHLLKNEAPLDDHMSAYVGQILSAADRAAILTNDLLTFSRKQIVNLQPVNLNKIIKDMESLLLRVIGEDIELTTILTNADLTIMADSTQIDQILMNLATNAQDAMPKGGSFIIRTDRVEINLEYIKAYDYGKPGSYALLSVEDTGTGMDENIRERIFEPFFTTKEVGKGTGLGLAMVYGIVKQHNGYINVYSESGRGTTFKILLPLIQSEVKEIKPEDSQKVKGGSETILVGEDNAQVRNLLKEVLSNAGYHIIEAVDGNDAVKVFDKNKDNIHLLILDVIMPKKNGKEVYAEIRKIKANIKVIFVSGYSADVIYKKGLLEVGLNFISKPTSPDNLLIKVRNVIDN